jgi:SAM-dependent methyltransferase/tetratricopeptide (TPR) repeat protein
VGPLAAPAFAGSADGVDFVPFGRSGPVPFDPSSDRLADLFRRAPAGGRVDAVLWWSPEDSALPPDVADCPVPTAAVLRRWPRNFWATRPALDAFDLVLASPAGADALARAGALHAAPAPVLPFTCTPGSPRGAGGVRDIDVALVIEGLGLADKRAAELFYRAAGAWRGLRTALVEHPSRPEGRQRLTRARIVVARSAHGELPAWLADAVDGGALVMIEAESRDADLFVEHGVSGLRYDGDLDALVERWLAREPERAAIVSAAQARLARATLEEALGRLAHPLREGLGRARALRGFSGLAPGERAYRLGVKALFAARSSAWPLAERLLRAAAEDPAVRARAQATLAATVAAAAERAGASPDRLREAAGNLAAEAAGLAPDEPVIRLTLAELARRDGDVPRARSLYLGAAALAEAGACSSDPLPLPFPFFADPLRELFDHLAITAPADFPGQARAALGARAWRRLGEQAVAAGEEDTARDALGRAISLGPSEGDAAFALGRMLEARSREDEAIERYAALVADRPWHLPGLGALAYVLYNRGWREHSAAVCRHGAGAARLASAPYWEAAFAELLGSCERRSGLAGAAEPPLPGGVRTTWRVVNKLADAQDLTGLGRRAVVSRLLEMKGMLDALGLPYSKQASDHWLRLWEYSGAIVESGVDSRMEVLDAGGTGTVLSYYLAAEGCRVTTVDINAGKLRDARLATPALGLGMRHVLASITDLPFPAERFDAVFSICVIEHLARADQSRGMAELARVLRPGGVLALTFDYGPDAADNPFLSPREVLDRLIVPAGLPVLGNPVLAIDPDDWGGANARYTFGSLFLMKPGRLGLGPAPRPFPTDAFPALHLG